MAFIGSLDLVDTVIAMSNTVDVQGILTEMKAMTNKFQDMVEENKKLTTIILEDRKLLIQAAASLSSALPSESTTPSTNRRSLNSLSTKSSSSSKSKYQMLSELRTDVRKEFENQKFEVEQKVLLESLDIESQIINPTSNDVLSQPHRTLLKSFRYRCDKYV